MEVRYRFAGKSRVMNLGSYTDLPRAAACQSAKELRAKIALGHDVAGEQDIKPHLGKLALDSVESRHIDAMLRAVVKRGAPTIANDVLRWVRRMFDYAIKRHLVRFNPAAAFDLADAGGKELARERALSSDELVALLEAMRQAKGFSGLQRADGEAAVAAGHA